MNKGVGKMNCRIGLYTIVQGQGISKPAETRKRWVWADVDLMGINTQVYTATINKQVVKMAVVWKNAYKNETHVIFDGVSYKISNITPAENEMKLKLMLSRG